MNLRISWFVTVLVIASAVPLPAAEDPATRSQAPKPRPRITESLRLKAEDIAREADPNRSVMMDQVVVRGTRLPSAPPKEESWGGKFFFAEGGYVFKRQGETFTTQVGLWRHVDIIEDKVEQLKQSTRIKVDFLRISW
jgi:hypothetical protein